MTVQHLMRKLDTELQLITKPDPIHWKEVGEAVVVYFKTKPTRTDQRLVHKTFCKLYGVAEQSQFSVEETVLLGQAWDDVHNECWKMVLKRAG